MTQVLVHLLAYNISSTYFQKQNPPVFSMIFQHLTLLTQAKQDLLSTPISYKEVTWLGKASNLVLTNALR